MVGSAFPFERYECPKIYPVIITEKVMIILLKFDLRNSIVIFIFYEINSISLMYQFKFIIWYEPNQLTLNEPT
jgi:hypothetical protein